MTFRAEILAAKLASAAARVASIVRTGSFVPIIGNALLLADGGRLTIAATNMDQGLSLTVDAAAEGSITVPAAKLAAIAARLDADAPVTLAEDRNGQSVMISQGRSIFRLPALPAVDWPSAMVMPLGDAAERWAVDAAALTAMIRSLEGAMAHPTTLHPYLAGLYLDLAERDAALVATDGHVMGAIDLVALGPPRAASVVLPSETLRPILEIAKLANAVDIGLSDAAVTIEAAGVRLRTKLIDGKYPDWRSALPAEMSTQIVVEADRLALALKRAALVSADQKESKARLGTGIALLIGTEELTVSARNGNGEEAVDALPCERMDGGDDPIRIETRAPYLSWAVDSLNTDTIDIGIDSPGRPLALRKHGTSAWRHIIETRRT